MRKRWEDNIKMHLKEIGCKAGMSTELSQNRVQWRTFLLAVLKIRVPLPQSAIKFI